MNPPKCQVYPPSTRYKQIAVRSLQYDGETLTIEVQGDGFAYARLTFNQPAGFRVLDERDLCEFWNDYHAGNGWMYEVTQGGWLEQETSRPQFLTSQMFPDLKEYLVVCDQCTNVLTVFPPDIIDLGSDPA